MIGMIVALLLFLIVGVACFCVTLISWIDSMEDFHPVIAHLHINVSPFARGKIPLGFVYAAVFLYLFVNMTSYSGDCKPENQELRTSEVQVVSQEIPECVVGHVVVKH